MKEFDYSEEGQYFITICVQNRECLFGEIVGEEVRLSEIGKIARQCWMEIPDHFKNVDLDAFVVMPNHLHGIISINNVTAGRGVQLNAPTRISPRCGTLSVIVRTYKAAVTTLCRGNGHPEFKWQRNYYEHVIRDDDDLHRIQESIEFNPIQWASDKENPENVKSST